MRQDAAKPMVMSDNYAEGAPTTSASQMATPIPMAHPNTTAIVLSVPRAPLAVFTNFSRSSSLSSIRSNREPFVGAGTAGSGAGP